MPIPYRIPLSAPALIGREREYVNDAISKNQLTAGEYVERFEAAFAAYLGVPYAVATSSGTTALHLACLAAGIRPGLPVQVTPLTYIASINAVRYCGARPAFRDVDPRTWNRALSRGRRLAALVVHLYGVPAPVPIAEAVVEDAAEALGAQVDGVAVGTQGTAGVFSFYGNKVITTGEGGMVVTRDPEIAATVRHLRGQGQDPTRRYWHTALGYNYRMTNLQAAIGVGQLEQIEEHLRVRRGLWERYAENLDGIVTWQAVPTGCTRAPWLFACRLPSPDQYRPLVATLEAVGIESRPVFPPVHLMPMYQGAEGDFPVAEAIHRAGICLPLHYQLTLAEVDEVCRVVRASLAEPRR